MPDKYLPGEIEQLVLLAVLRLDGEGYAVPIRELIVREGGVRVSRGTVYVTLDRLEQKGLLRSAFGRPQPVRGGKSRRVFQITRTGMEALRHARRAVERLAAGTRLASDGLE
jgi:PadR family transcriptional regulator, regulatory protein PadR